MITNERRAFRRYNVNFTVTFKPHSSSDFGTSTATTKNISVGGVYFTSLKMFDIGELIDCRIKMPGIEKEGKWLARVVRCENVSDQIFKTYGIAVEFIRSFGDSEKNLRKILEGKKI
jgi:hypothetical protein